MNEWKHVIHQAHKAKESGDNKAAAIMYIIVGLFLTPWLIGLPILIYGVSLLRK